MTELLQPHAIGADRQREDGPAKVTGTAPYAFEHLVEGPAYLFPVRSTIALGEVTTVDTREAEATAGVLFVLTPENAPRLASTEDAELAVLQDSAVAFRGQFVAAVVAETPEVARHAADLVRIGYHQQQHDTELRAHRADLYKPDQVNPTFPTDTALGDVDAAMASAAAAHQATYTTAMYHNNPMEPHASIASWTDDGLTVYDSTQGVHPVRDTLATVFDLDHERIRVICPHVGGGFGSKGLPHAHLVLAVLAARMTGGRPVKFALTRQQMFALTGYRTPTIQQVRLAADERGQLSAIGVDVVEQTSRIKEFAEQSALPARSLYAAANRRTSHRLAALDVPVPSWMRAPGECPGMFGPEVAMDELAVDLGIDPVELRLRNDTGTDPETGMPFSSRNLAACLRDGAERFGWQHRDPAPGAHREGRWQVGTGVASSTYPAGQNPEAVATIRFDPDVGYSVLIGAADLGTGAWTVLAQIAADALGVGYDDVDLHIGDTDLPRASVAGGSTGTATWGAAIVEAARRFRSVHGEEPFRGAEIQGYLPANPDAERFAMRAFGAQFAEARVDRDTGEIRIPRLLGVFAVGRVINPRTARSQFVGGMTMGLSMALHEQSVLDGQFGHVVNQDFAQYHIATNADVESVEAHWIDEHDPHVNPVGSKGIGEIGIVGTAAAIANAAHHATGVRVRNLPLTLEDFLH